MFKKISKRFFSILTVVTLLMSISIPAFAASTNDVGTLTIFSSNDGGSSSFNTSGHAFLAFENTSSESIVVGGLNVGSGHEITFGTWGNQDGHNGIWYNLESYFVHNLSAYNNRVSLSMSVSQDEIDDINALISANDTWSLTNNCSSFATKLWNQISSTDVSAGAINTPTSLMNSIKSKTGYQTNRSIGNTTPIGYVGSNGFVSVTMSATKALHDSVIPNTTEGNAIIITPINMNPNSME